VAEKLLDRAGHRDVAGRELSELVGVGEQRRDAVADEVRGGFVTGEEQERAGGDDLIVGEPITFCLRGHECVDEPARHAPAGVGDEAVQVLGDLGGRDAAAPFDVGGSNRLHVDARSERVSPGRKRRAIFRRHAEQFADHVDGQRIGEVGEKIRSAVRRKRVEASARQCFHVGTQLFDAPRGEGPNHEPTKPVVIGRVAEQHRPVHEPREPIRLRVLAVLGRLGFVDTHRLLTQHRVDARVARDDPRPDPRPVDGMRRS
jgi:hypothetical protein